MLRCMHMDEQKNQTFSDSRCTSKNKDRNNMQTYQTNMAGKQIIEMEINLQHKQNPFASSEKHPHLG